MQIRPYRPQVSRAIQWIAYGSNPFNTLVPFFPNVNSTPKYLEDTTTRVTSENFYWENRIIAALCDSSFRHRQRRGTLSGEDRRDGPPHGCLYRRADRTFGG